MYDAAKAVLNALPAVLKERFNGKYPTRKAYTSDFIRKGIRFQIDAIAGLFRF